MAAVRRHVRIAVGLVVAVAAGAGACGVWAATAGGAGQQNASRVAAVQAAFRHAIEADASFGSPSAAYQASVMAAIDAHRQALIVPAAEQSQLMASGMAAIARYFGSAQALLEQVHLTEEMALDSNPNIINLGSGVSHVNYLHEAVMGARATVEADVTIWAKSEARQTTAGPWLMTDPVNVVDDRATLTLSPSGPWQVMWLTEQDVPGSGP